MNRFSAKALPLARIVYRSPPNSAAWHQAASDLVAGQPGASFWAGSPILPVWLTSQQLAQNVIQASPARHKSGNRLKVQTCSELVTRYKSQERPPSTIHSVNVLDLNGAGDAAASGILGSLVLALKSEPSCRKANQLSADGVRQAHGQGQPFFHIQHQPMLSTPA